MNWYLESLSEFFKIHGSCFSRLGFAFHNRTRFPSNFSHSRSNNLVLLVEPINLRFRMMFLIVPKCEA